MTFRTKFIIIITSHTTQYIPILKWNKRIFRHPPLLNRQLEVSHIVLANHWYLDDLMSSYYRLAHFEVVMLCKVENKLLFDAYIFILFRLFVYYIKACTHPWILDDVMLLFGLACLSETLSHRMILISMPVNLLCPDIL